ncbi:MAG: MFS transporter, partial [Salinisphaera sp.]|uniref:MFS transporter n=1 Tax=Salinisphaera sp. TaxID=1914330 RepID=UPI003C7D06BE
ASTGLASPPMAAAVARAVRPERQDLTNTVVNAGTSAGVALSGPIALVLGQDWRLVFAIFAAAALAMAVVAFVVLPRHTGGGQSPVSSGLPRISPNLARLIGASFLMGASSTALWSFGGELAAARLGWLSAGIGLLWIAMGAAGIVGAGAGALVARWGLNTVHWTFLAMLAASILAVGLPLTTPMLTLAGGALFGAAYVTLTGVYLVWGISALPERPATGLMVGFLTAAIGQTAGAPVFGLLMGQLSPTVAAASFAVLGLVAGALRWQAAGSETPSAARAMS